MREQVKLSVFYPHPPERVWKALTNRHALSIWMMENDFEPRLGHKFKFENSSLPGLKTTIYCEVIELEEPKRLVYTWQDNLTGKPTLVIWTLTTAEGGTQLQLTHHESGLAATVISGSENETLETNGIYAGLFLSKLNSIPFTPKSDSSLFASMSSPSLEEFNRFVFNLSTKDKWEYRLTQKLSKVLLLHY
ncbi:MAG: SRPBCC domain-containing protein [Scytonema sp. PMC 1069.18]|nr:SRPBCC domain-containing protein [Scytonema sp. PMC 1069.18]MEC4885873.1 SRPBCC domain-containing protein [Scytonema sp. PMC 1070.18]